MGYGWDFAPRLVRSRHPRPGAPALRPARTGCTTCGRAATLTPTIAARRRWRCGQGRWPARRAGALHRPREGQPRGSAEADADAASARRRRTGPARSLVAERAGRRSRSTPPTAECADGSDRVGTTFGVREVRWEGRPGGAPEEWPLTLVVNGRRVFQRGWNWVPADAWAAPAPTGGRDGSAPGPARRGEYPALLGRRRPGDARLLCGVRPAGSPGLAGVPAFFGGDQQHRRRPTRLSGPTGRLMRAAVIAARRNHPSLALGVGATS